MLATRTSRWTALTALVCLVLVAVTWFFLVSPRRAEAADVREATEAARAQNDALELEIAQLKAQFAELPEKKAELAAVHAQMPAAAAMPELVRSLDAAANASSVVLKEITPGAATLMAAPEPAAGASTATGATGGEAPAGGGETAGDPAAGAGAATASSGPRVVTIPMTVAVEGGYFQTVNFLKRLQTELPRVFLVTSLQIANPESSSAADGSVSLTIGGKVFALPDATASDATAAAASGSTASTAPSTQPATTETGTT